MKYLLIIGDGMADNPVESLGGRTPLETAAKPTIDALSRGGILGNVVNCPPPLPSGSETAILSIFGCDPLRYFTGRSPMEAASLGIRLDKGDACFRCNLITLEEGEMPFEERRILSHSAGSITAEEGLEFVKILNADEEFSSALKHIQMELPEVPATRPLAVQHNSDYAGCRFIPPHDHLGSKCGAFLPSGTSKAEEYISLEKLAYRILSSHPLNEKRRSEGKMPANGIWLWAEGTAVSLPGFREQYGCSGAVISAVPICHGIGVLRGLEKVEVPGATGEIDTNFEGKLEAAWEKINEYDFICVHLEAPDECTHNGDLPGKIQSIAWLDSRILSPLLSRMDGAGMEYRILLLSDHKTLTSTRGHDGDPVPFLLYDSRVSDASGKEYTEANGMDGLTVPSGCKLLDLLFEK